MGMSWPSNQRSPESKTLPLACSPQQKVRRSQPALLMGWEQKGTSPRPRSAPYRCDSRCLRCKRCRCCWVPHWTPIAWPASPRGHPLRAESATWMSGGSNGASETKGWGTAILPKWQSQVQTSPQTQTPPTSLPQKPLRATLPRKLQSHISFPFIAKHRLGNFKTLQI